jgi:hypothetical protein
MEMVAKNRILILIVFCLIFISAIDCKAQYSIKETEKYKGSFSIGGKISLDSLTKLLHKSNGIRLSFNSIKVKGSKEINFKKGSYSLLEILKEIRLTTSLYYSFFSGYIIFQDHAPKQQNQTNSKKVYESNAKNKSTKEVFKLKKGFTKTNKSVSPIFNNHTKDSSVKNNKIVSDSLINSDIYFTKNNLNINNITPKETTQTTAAFDSIKPKQEDSVSKIMLFEKKKFIDTTTTLKTINKLKKINKQDGQFHYGFIWNINIPFYGFKEYYTSSNASFQFYNAWIPGIWLSKKIGKKENELLLQIKPEQQFLMGNQLIEVTKESASPQDSNIVTNKISLIKTNTFYAGLQYNYSIGRNLSLNLGVKYNWQLSALLNKQTSNKTDIVILDTLYGINPTSQTWQYLKSNFLSSSFEFVYAFKKLYLGSSMNIPVTSIFSDKLKITNPLSGYLFLRWSIN